MIPDWLGLTAAGALTWMLFSAALLASVAVQRRRRRRELKATVEWLDGLGERISNERHDRWLAHVRGDGDGGRPAKGPQHGEEVRADVPGGAGRPDPLGRHSGRSAGRR